MKQTFNIEQLEYTRRLYDNVLSWYKSADSKAQVIIAIDGGCHLHVIGFLRDIYYTNIRTLI